MTQSLPSLASPATQDTWAATWAANDAKTDDKIGEALNGPQGHTASEWHSGRFRLVEIGVDLGAPGTPLDTDVIGIVGHRVVRWPFELNTWAATASPSGATITFDVKKAASLADFNAGTYSSIVAGGAPGLSGVRADDGPILGTWSTVTFAVGEVIIFAVSAITPTSAEVVSFQVSGRRT